VSVLILLFEYEHILSLWRYNFALVGCVRILTENV